KFATVTGKGFRPRPFDLGRLRYAAAAMLVANFLLLLLVPVAMLSWVSLLPFYQPLSAAAFDLVTLANYRTVFSPDHVGLIVNTLLVATATATIAVALTFAAAWLSVRRAAGGGGGGRLPPRPPGFSRPVLRRAGLPLLLLLPLPPL